LEEGELEVGKGALGECRLLRSGGMAAKLAGVGSSTTEVLELEITVEDIGHGGDVLTGSREDGDETRVLVLGGRS
jgi:hypothetical protein